MLWIKNNENESAQDLKIHHKPKIIVFTALAMILNCQVAKANDDSLTEAGDVLQFLLPLSALGTTYLYHDKKVAFSS